MTAKSPGRVLCATWFLWVTASVGIAPGAAGPEPAADAPADETILAAGGCWRVYAVRAPGVIPLQFVKERKPDATEPFCIDTGWMPSPPPPPGWTEPDFDDSAWPRLAGPFSGGYVGWARQYQRQGRALICLRGKFRVDDPSGVKRLTLSARYQGGLVVYLNGREVYRGHLPQGALSALTTAEPYPREAYVDAAGKVIPSLYHLQKRLEAGDADLERRLALRTRSTGRLDLPLAGLRKGVNVLALELHRSAFRPEILTADRMRAAWPHVGLSRLRLAAQARGGAVTPNIARPEGVQVWNEDTTAVFGPAAYGDPNEPLLPIRLVGVRGGYHSAQVVVGSTGTLSGLRTAVSDLTARDGGGRIPADQVRIRYPRLTRMGVLVKGPGYRSPAFAVLEEEPPGVIEPAAPKTSPRRRSVLGLAPEVVPGAVQPIWVTVYVPEGTRPGAYRGTITIRADDNPDAVVPLRLRVYDFTVPTRGHLKTAFALMQGYLEKIYGAENVTAQLRQSYGDFLLQHHLNPDDISRTEPPAIEDIAHYSTRGLNAFNVLNMVEPRGKRIWVCYSPLSVYTPAFKKSLITRLDPYVAELKKRGLIDKAMILSAVRTSRIHQLSLWDALIVQSATESGCRRLLTEDLQHGQRFGGIIGQGKGFSQRDFSYGQTNFMFISFLSGYMKP